MMNSPPPGRLDTRQRYIRAGVWTLVHFLLWAMLFVAAVAVVPHFLQRFEDFNLELPAITIMVIDLSRLVRKYWYLVAFLGLVGLWLNWLTLSNLGKLGSKRLSAAGILVALVPLFLGAFGFLAIWLPWLKITEILAE